MAANFLYVQTHDSKDPRVELPYHELMPFRVYLTTVLAPAFHSTIKDNGCTVADCFRYISDDLCIRVRFDREHRNERLGNFIPPGATLTRFPDRGESDGLYGNAVRGDLTQLCPICHDKSPPTDFELGRCAHRFHTACAAAMLGRSSPKCPVCRAEYARADQRLHFQFKKVREPWAPRAALAGGV